MLVLSAKTKMNRQRSKTRASDCWWIHIPRLIAENFAVGGRDMHVTSCRPVHLEFDNHVETSDFTARLWIADKGTRGTLRLPHLRTFKELPDTVEGFLAIHRDEANQLSLEWEWNGAK
jgi:hypothetical protein